MLSLLSYFIVEYTLFILVLISAESLQWWMPVQFLLDIFCFQCREEDFVNESSYESTTRYYSMNTMKDWRHEQKTNIERNITINWMIRRTNQLVLIWMRCSSDSSIQRFEQFLYYSLSRETRFSEINHDFFSWVHQICDWSVSKNCSETNKVYETTHALSR